MTEAQPSRRRLQGELAVALAFMALGGFVFYETSTSFVEAGAASGGAMMNAAMFPNLLASGLVILGLCQMARIGLAVVRPAAESVVAEMAEPLAAVEPGMRVRAILCGLAFLAYIASLRQLGYHLATPVLLFVMFRTLGVAGWIRPALLAVAVSLGLSFVFEFGLDVILPVGRFGIGF